jgi:hypothetical protein
MKPFFSNHYSVVSEPETEYAVPSLAEDIRATLAALDTAYAGFDNAVNEDMIDCYIYEINSLLKRYKHLSDLASQQKTEPEPVSGSPLRFRFVPAIQNLFLSE